MKTNNTNNIIEFFSDEVKNPRTHFVFVRRTDNYQLVIFGLDHNGYEGKAIVCPGHDEDVVNAAIAYLEENFSDLTWKKID